MIREKNILVLMDSHLEGNFSTEEATSVVDLASLCLQYEPRDRPDTKKIVATLAPLQTKSDVPSHVMLRSPLGEACSRMDLTTIHQILVMAHYKEDQTTNEPSFQEWTQQMRDIPPGKDSTIKILRQQTSVTPRPVHRRGKNGLTHSICKTKPMPSYASTSQISRLANSFLYASSSPSQAQHAK